MNNPKSLSLATILLWSFGAYLTRLISIKSQFILLSVSFSFTFLTFLIYNWYSHKGKLFHAFRIVNLKYIVIGLTGYFIYWIGLIQSSRSFDSISETMILNYSWPVFTIIFTETLFRRGSSQSILHRMIEGFGVVVGVLGVVVIATRGNIYELELVNPGGLGWGLLAGISYGLFSAFSGTVPNNEHSQFLLVSIFFSLLLMIGCSLTEQELLATLTFKDILVAALLGCLLDGMGYITWTRANRLAREKEINISSIASVMFILPVLSLIIVSIFLQERLLFQPFFLVSLSLVMISSFICQRSDLLEIFLCGKTRKY